MKGKIIAYSIVSVVAIILIVILVVWLKKNVFSKVTTPAKDKTLTADDVFSQKGTANEDKVSNDDIQEADALAKALYEDMDGLNWLGHKRSLYERLNLCSDRELSIVNAVFNKNYGEGETLSQWIANESWNWGDTYNALIDSILERLTKCK